MSTIFTALAFALLLAIAALCREVQFRRALQSLVRRIVTHWRTNQHETPLDTDHDGRSGDDDGV